MIRLLYLLLLLDISGFSQSSLQFSHDAGVYDASFFLKIKSETNTPIYYTTSTNNDPKLYQDSLWIDKTTTFLFRHKVDEEMRYLDPKSFFIDFNTEFSIVSLTIQESDLFDSISGLYVDGENWRFDSIYKIKKNANYAKRWERNVFLELFNPLGNRVLSQNAGLRIFGGLTRFYPEKSLRLIARKKYGEKRFEANVFGDSIVKYKQLVLRHSGNDYKQTRFKDALSTDLASEVGICVQKFAPSHLFVNSEYWGVYNIREKINKYFIDNKYNTGVENINIIKGYIEIEEGKIDSYSHLIDFVKENNFDNDSNYLKLIKLIDIEQFMNYWIYQIYFSNMDSRGNVRFWNSDSINQRFKPILYDIDLGWFRCDSNYLVDFSSPSQTKWYNPSCRTLLFSKALENKQFRNRFINQVSILLSTHLSAEHIIRKINDFKSLYKNEMIIHFRERKKFQSYQGSINRWKRSIDKMVRFASLRDSVFLVHLTDKFNLKKPYHLNISINNHDKGQVFVNDFKLNDSVVSGVFFEDVPLCVSSVPNENYISFNFQLDTILLNDSLIRFREIHFKSNTISSNSVFVNEIDLLNQNIEIYNNSNTDVKLDGWELFTNTGSFVIDSLTIPKNRFCILYNDRTVDKRDSVIYKKMAFKLGIVDKICLYSSIGVLVDTVSFHSDNSFKSYSRSSIVDLENSKFNYSYFSSIGSHNKGYLEQLNMITIIRYECNFIWFSFIILCFIFCFRFNFCK